jgi:hypothetical protein
MNVMFRTRMLLGIVDGSLPRELVENQEEWMDKDAVCQSIIISA